MEFDQEVVGGSAIEEREIEDEAITLKKSNDANSPSAALSGSQMKAFASKHFEAGCLVIDISDLNSEYGNSTTSSKSLPLNVIIYTGDEINPFSKYPKHWICLFSDSLFDAMGHANSYTLPLSYDKILTQPPRLQQYGSNVCGEYCLAFLNMCNNELELNETSENYGSIFSNTFGFTDNHKENDEIVRKWYLYKEEN